MRSLAFAVAVATSCIARTASAGANEASDHHRAGVAYAKSGKWGDAVREFDEAYKLDPTPLRLYDVAQVCLQAKQYVRARDAYARVADSASLSNEQQQRARAGLATAKSNIGRVRIFVVSARPGDVVTVDGARAREDVVEVDPGKHTVRLVRDGETSDVTVDVSPGGETNATVGDKKQERQEDKAAPAVPPREGSSGGGVPTATWVFGGLAIGALSVGIPLAVTGYVEYNDIKENDPCARDSTCGGRDEEPRRRAIIGDIVTGVGVVSAAVAIYFLLTAGGPSAPKTAGTASFTRVDLRAASGGGSIGIRGSF